MARHNQGSEIPAENTTPKQHRVQRMLPTRTHCLGEVLQYRVIDDDSNVRLICIDKDKSTQSCFGFLAAGDGVLSRLCLGFVRR